MSQHSEWILLPFLPTIVTLLSNRQFENGCAFKVATVGKSRQNGKKRLNFKQLFSAIKKNILLLIEYFLE